MSPAVWDALIVGGGLAGLMAGARLSAAGRRALVIEKEPSVGGRLATCAIDDGQADSGAQFFTVRSAEFRAVVADWLRRGLVYKWSRGWSGGSLHDLPPDGYPRYAARNGFGALARRLADNLDVHPGTCLIAALPEDDCWIVTDGDGFTATGRALILTAPTPQSLALLDESGVTLPTPAREALAAIRYGPCLCGLFHIEGGFDLPYPGACQRPGEAISWVADNRRKGISPGATLLTVHADVQNSLQRWSDDDAGVLSWMWHEIRSWRAAGTTVRSARLKRWRYAVPLHVHPAPYLRIDAFPAPLLLAGDAFAGPRVEGAVLSGLAAADALLNDSTAD